MLLTKERSPWDLDRLFEDLWKPVFPFAKDMAFVPSCDLFEDKEGYTVQVELAGMTAKDVQVETDGNLLTIRGEKKWEEEKKDRQYYRSERRYGSFFRQVTLPESADISQAVATHKEGVLSIRFPKKEEARKKTVQISVK